MSLEDQIPFRSLQLQQLTSLYSRLYPFPLNLIVQGLEGTCKLRTVRAVLDECEVPHAVVRCEECLSLRHLLSKILSTCTEAAIDDEDPAIQTTYEGHAETINALIVSLQTLLRGRDKDFILVLDGIDRQRGMNQMSLPALARLSDIVPNLCLIFIVSTPRSLFLQKPGVPCIQFLPYTRAEAISLVTRSPPPLAPPKHLDGLGDAQTLERWYALFATSVYDSLFSATSLSVSHFQQICESLWPRFIWPYVNNETPPGKGRSPQWDFSKLLVRQRSLFQHIGEEALAAKLLRDAQTITFVELERDGESLKASSKTQSLPIDSSHTTYNVTSLGSSTQISSSQTQPKPLPLLSFFPTLLLTASYLASHTPQKLDILLFSRLSSSSRSARSKRNYHKRKLFQSPSKGTKDGAVGKTPKKTTSKTKAGLEMNLNLARGFTLERLIAIVRAIHPHGVPISKSIVDQVCRHLAELERLRLVVLGDGGGGQGRSGGDEGGAEEKKWKINVSRGFVEELGGQYEREGLAGLIREYELLET